MQAMVGLDVKHDAAGCSTFLGRRYQSKHLHSGARRCVQEVWQGFLLSESRLRGEGPVQRQRLTSQVRGHSTQRTRNQVPEMSE